MRSGRVLMFALAAVAVMAPSSGSTTSNVLEEVTGPLRARLKAQGRAEVQLERRETDPLTGKLRTTRGELALEPPAFARLQFPASGEEVAVREDGCEWVQPGLQQMLRIPGERLAGVLRWWRLFAGADADQFVARRVGQRRYVVMPVGAPGDSARVRLAKSGLPYELEIDEGLETPTVYRLTGWKFAPPRGAKAFVLKAPDGYEVVELP